MADEVKAIENHCPYGCPDHNLDELGYCEHLVGFSNDGLVLEPLVLRRRYSRDQKEWIEDGNLMTDGREIEEVQSEDKRVNPTFIQTDDHGIEHVAKRWVSERIYSDNPDRKPVKVTVVKKSATRRQMAAPVTRSRPGMRPPVEEQDESTTPGKGKPKAKAKAEVKAETAEDTLLP